MCRHIQPLFNFDPPTADENVRAAALQFARKISGFTKPLAANGVAFGRAVRDVTAAAPDDRAETRTRAKARAEKRFAHPSA
jgi:hypothetical protein